MLFERYTKAPDEISWRALTYFNFYRFLVAFLFVSLYWIGQLPEPLGAYDRSIFAITAHVYMAFSVVNGFFIQIKQPRYRVQVATHVLGDILIITALMYASAGLNSGFGMLLIIAVAGGAILSPGRLSILFAAVAALAVLMHEVYAYLLVDFPPANYTHAGFLGITFFVTAIICQELSNRVDESRALARRQAEDIRNLSQLNTDIVQRMQSGIVVVDDTFIVRLANNAAQNLLNITVMPGTISISEISPELYRGMQAWLERDGERTMIFRPSEGFGDVQASFSKLSIEGRFQILVFIEDMSMLRQRAQQMKLASLGRLTASIAHEIRNPLGAISHAGQLLAESGSLASEDQRLTSIIKEHSYRVNRIIENILGVSRRSQAAPVRIELHKWLEDMISEFEIAQKLEPEAIRLNTTDEKVNAQVDPEQLRQVVWNLMENGIRYSHGTPLLEIECSRMNETDRPYIDIKDKGPGINENDVPQLFEPFFTTSSEGSGLGLYIARELCEANQASLILHENDSDGCCFRIVFSHPEKQHSLA